MDRHSLHMIWRSTGLTWSTWMQQDMIRICSSNSVPQAIPSPLFARFPIPTKFTALSHVWDYLQAHFRISRMTCGLVSAEFRVRALRCPCWMRQCGICHYFFSKSWWNCWFKSICTISSQVFFFFFLGGTVLYDIPGGWISLAATSTGNRSKVWFPSRPLNWWLNQLKSMARFLGSFSQVVSTYLGWLSSGARDEPTKLSIFSNSNRQ